MYMQSAEQQKTAKSEIDALKRFQHENIIKMIDFTFGFEAEKGQIAFLLFPYTEGGSLRDVLTAKNAASGVRLQLATVLTGFIEVCHAINVLHSFSPPYVHRDIKPEVSVNATNKPMHMSKADSYRFKCRSEHFIQRKGKAFTDRFRICCISRYISE